MADTQPSPKRRFPKVSVNSKDISRRLKKVEGATVKHARRFVVRRMDSFRIARRHIAIWVLAIGMIIGATGLQFWWYQQGYRANATEKGGTYAEATQGPLTTLNPLYVSSSAEESVSELVFSRLLRYDTSGQLNYDLAESMKISDDAKTYTVSIRPDARWQDGRYVRARDVIFTVGLVKNSATRSTITGWNSIKVTEVDPLTVSFELPAVYASFPHALKQLPILPEHLLRDIEPSQLRENSFSSKPVGSGPFSVRAIQEVDASNGRKVVHLVRNDDYYRGAAVLDRLQLHVYKDTEAIKRALSTAEVNAATDVSVLDSLAVNTSRYDVDRHAINSGVYAILNTTSPMLSDVKVRQALQAATDTAKIRQQLAGDIPALYLPFVSGQVTSVDMPGPPAHDMIRAGQLLNEAGWILENGTRTKDGQPLKLSIVTTKNNDFEKALDVISGQWRELGVTITTSIVDPNDPSQNVAQDVLQPRQYDVLLYRLTIGGDPDVYAYWHSSQASGGFNFSNYKSSISDDALVSARTRIEPALRNAKYATFAKQWLTDVPAIGLYQSTTQYIHTKGAEGSSAQDKFVSSTDRYNDVLYWSIGSRLVYKTP